MFLWSEGNLFSKDVPHKNKEVIVKHITLYTLTKTVETWVIKTKSKKSENKHVKDKFFKR